MGCIIINGGVGNFIGSHLARELHRHGLFARIPNIKLDEYIKANFCSENLTKDLHIQGKLS